MNEQAMAWLQTQLNAEKARRQELQQRLNRISDALWEGLGFAELARQAVNDKEQRDE